MTYLITGATGFIGRALVAELLSQGHSVNYLARTRSNRLDSRAAFHCWNVGEKPPLNSVPRTDAVIHLAGEPVAQRWTAEVKKKIHSSRVDGTRRLVDAIGELKHKPSVLVSASAVGYYGNRGEEVLTEASGPGSGFLADVCVAWEREAERAAEFGLRVVMVRIATVLGRDGGALPALMTPFRFGLGARLGNGRQWMSWIQLSDLVRLLLFAAEHESVSGPVNASAPNQVTNAEFTRTLAAALHRPAIFSAPKLPLRLALGEMADVLFDSLRVVPEAAQKAGFEFRYPRAEDALKVSLA